MICHMRAKIIINKYKDLSELHHSVKPKYREKTNVKNVQHLMDLCDMLNCCMPSDSISTNDFGIFKFVT